MTLFTPSPSRVGHPGDPYSRAMESPVSPFIGALRPSLTAGEAKSTAAGRHLPRVGGRGVGRTPLFLFSGSTDAHCLLSLKSLVCYPLGNGIITIRS